MTNHSKLSDAELCAAVAPLLGWVNGYSQDAQDRLLSWSGIGLVVEAMREKGWWMRLDSPFNATEPYWAGFTPLNTTGWNGRPDHKASDPIPWRAVYIAALAAREEE